MLQFKRNVLVGDDMQGGIKKILIMRNDGLGDFILSLPAMNALRRAYPKAYIVLFSCNWHESLARATGLFDEIISWDKSGNYYLVNPRGFRYLSLRIFKYLFKLSSMKFDLAIDFKTDPRNRIIMWLCGIKKRVGFNSGLFKSLLNLRVDFDASRNESEIDLKLIGAIVNSNPDIVYKFNLPVAEKEEAVRFLNVEGVLNIDKIIVIHPIARWPAKMWPKEKSAALADRLLALPYVKVIFIGASEDLGQIIEIRDMMKIPPIIAAGKLNFLQASAIIERASLFVGNDAAPMHMAGVLNIPTVALFGPTDPKTTGPLGQKTEIIRKIKNRCQGCFKKNIGKCINIPQFCMDKISVDEIFEICLKYLR